MTDEQMSTKVKELVHSAKYGHWDVVFGILNSHPEFINSIPEDRTWAVLHQAAWWRNEEVVKRILAYDSCDYLVRTKQNRDHPAMLTAADIAKNICPSSAIQKILADKQLEQRHAKFGEHVPYYVTASQGEEFNEHGLPLLLLTLYGYKKTFHSTTIDLHQHFSSIMKEIFNYEHNNHWSNARDKISSALSAFDHSKSVQVSKTSSEDAFYDSIVEIYSQEGGQLYKYVNEALNREGKAGKYKPTGKDLALGPYALMLDVVLFFWPSLNAVSATTYRGIGMSREAASRYSTNSKFVWLQFVSSSKSESVARGFGRRGAVDSHYALFEITNCYSNKWKPRDIENYSQIPQEKEALYPAGAEFRVTNNAYKGSDGSYCYYTLISLTLVN